MSSLKKNNFHIPPLSLYGKGYTISFEKENIPGLPREEWDTLQKIHQDPKAYFQELVILDQKFPQVFALVNLLTFAHLQRKEKKQAEALIEKAYRDFPDSLVAKINYADQLLRTKQVAKVLEVFDQHTDLNTLYPERETYHYAEFRGFMVVMGFYFAEQKQYEKAEGYYQLAFQVDPLHPSVSLLEKKISPSLAQKLARIFKIR